MHDLIRTALVLAVVLTAVPLGASAGTTTSVDNGVQMIVTTPDVAAAKKPKKKPSGKAKAVAKAIVPDIVPDGPSDANKRYANAVVENAEALIGRPYRFGGTTLAGFDCSGYTQYVFRKVGIAIPRTADAQFAAGRKIAGDPLPGDLVFFQTYDYGASHVAIYLGGGQFAQSIGTNVNVGDFNSPYFRGRYLGARRFLPE